MVKKRGLEGRVRIESAATHTDEIWNGEGSPVYPPAVSVLMEHGIGGPENELGLSRKRARLIERADYRRFDYLIGMDGANIVDMKKISGGDPDKKMFKFWNLREGTAMWRIRGIQEILKPRGRTAMMAAKGSLIIFFLYFDMAFPCRIC